MTRQERKRAILAHLNGVLRDDLNGPRTDYLWEGVTDTATETQMRRAVQELREEFQRRSEARR